MSAIQTIQEESFETTMTLLKTLDAHDLAKLLKAVIAELAKKMNGSKAPKKAGSMPKGVVPKQLLKPRAWVDFTLTHAKENGWESFTVHQTKKDKTTGEKIQEEIEMPASIEVEGRHIFPDSVDEKNPQGKTLIHKDAMSLSKHYWAPKTQEGTREDLYEEFLAQYEESDESEAESDQEVVQTIVDKKAEKEAEKAEKEAEKEEKKRVKEEEKAAKAAEKEAEKEAKKAEKEAEKAAKAAEKEAKKAEKPVAKAAANAPAKEVKVTPAAAKAPAKEVKVTPAKPSAKPAAIPQAPLKAAKAATTWSCPADGQLHRWTFNGDGMLRNSDNEVWKADADGGIGEWMGIYDPKTGTFDDSVEEPQFDE